MKWKTSFLGLLAAAGFAAAEDKGGVPAKGTNFAVEQNRNVVNWAAPEKAVLDRIDFLATSSQQCTGCHKTEMAGSACPAVKANHYVGWYNSAIYGAPQPGAGAGLTLTEPTPALRAQLKLEANKGLVVGSVAPASPAEKAGVKPYDVLLSAASQPLSKAEELELVLKAVQTKDTPLTLSVVRAGEPLKLSLKLAEATYNNASSNLQYWIGVGIGDIDETLRSQLRLAKDVGVVVTSVHKGLPAEKVGIREHDIVTAFDGKPVGSTEAFTKAIQATGEKTVAVALVREGRPIQLNIQPARREQPKYEFVKSVGQDEQSLNLVLRSYAFRGNRELALTAIRSRDEQVQSATPTTDPASEVRELVAESRRLLSKLEALEKRLSAAPAKSAVPPKKK